MKNDRRKTYEKERERLREKERKDSPGGNMAHSFHRAEHGGLVDLVLSLGWKGTGILILVLIIGFLIVSYFVS